MLWATWERDLLRLRRTPLRLMAPLVGPNLLLLSIGVGLVGNAAPESSRIVAGLALMSAYLMGGNLGPDVHSDMGSGVALDLHGSAGAAATSMVARAVLTGALGVGTAAVLWSLGTLLGMPAPANAVSVVGVALALALVGFISACWAALLGALSRSVTTLSGAMNVVFNALFFISGALYEPQSAPVGLRIATFLNPVYYLGELLRQLAGGSIGLAYWAPSLGVAAISGLALWLTTSRVSVSRYSWT